MTDAAAPLADPHASTPPRSLSAPVAQLLQQTMDLALKCHRAQQWPEAVTLYQAVLRLQPEHADANHNLGAITVEQGDPLGAIPFFQAALQANPKSDQYWTSLVDALIQAGEHQLATDILEDARRAGLNRKTVGELAARLVEIALRRARDTPPVEGREPPAAQGAQIGHLYNAERFNDVVKLGRKIARQYPQSMVGWKSLSAAFMRLGEREKAIEAMQRALELNLSDFDTLSNYGLALSRRGELVPAEVLLRQAVRQRPRLNAGWFNLGIVMRAQARFDDAERAYRCALNVGGDDVGVLLNLGGLLQEMNRLSEAEECARKVIGIKADSATAHIQLGVILKDQGLLTESMQLLRQAMALDPRGPGALSTLLFVANGIPDMDPQERFALYQEFDQSFGLPHRPHWRLHGNKRHTARRLRIGYVAPVFLAHSCQRFLEPLLANHNHERVELFAYANNYELDDEVTDRYRNYVEHWCDTRDLSDDQLSARIRADGIDVLVDIAGQTKGNRLSVFARKPAPVSLHWLDSGYTTGLTAIDYYLTDAATVPPGREDLFSETPWRLPRSPFAYRPDANMGPVSLLPALERGYITFGTLTRAVRLNTRLIAAWAQLLHRVPHAKLVINSPNFSQADTCELWIQRFTKLGITADRLEIGHQSPPWDVLRGMDIALDCFPQNSGTTLLESLYMGLPFISLAGTPSMGTLGASVLTALGRPEWIAHSEEEYIDKLVALASDVPALAQLRSGLRVEMEASPLMDESGFACDVEDAYFAMFQRWIDTNPEKKSRA